jgi:hypothetical protein
MSSAAEKNNTGRSKYKCGICGQPKKGHICQAVGGTMCVTPRPLANPCGPERAATRRLALGTGWLRVWWRLVACM